MSSTLENLYASGEYSDLTIICGPLTFKVHKNVVCTQSEFFRAACRPDAFQEGQTGVVNIFVSNARSDESRSVTAEEFDCDEDIENLKTVQLMIRYFCYHDYLEEEVQVIPFLPNYSRTPENLANGILAEHARMYAMGEKYGIPGLKRLALEKFSSCWMMNIGGFASAVPIAFLGTHDSDQDLRNLILDVLNWWGDGMVNEPAIDKSIREIPALAYALFRQKVPYQPRIEWSYRWKGW